MRTNYDPDNINISGLKEEIFNTQLRIGKKINEMRIKKTEQLCEERLPKWLIWLMNKFRKSMIIPKILGIKIYVQPIPLLESHLVHERLVLDMWGKKLGEIEFYVQDKRKINSDVKNV